MAPSKVPEPELSRTALLTRCKVCRGCEEDDKRFLICSYSECFYKYYHVECLTADQVASEHQLGTQRWYCPSCLCRSCKCDWDDDKVILCDSCDEAYHLYCLSPPKTEVPKEYWACKRCTDRKEEKRWIMLHRHDYDEDVLEGGEVHGLDFLIMATEKEMMGGKKVEVAKTSGK